MKEVGKLFVDRTGSHICTIKMPIIMSKKQLASITKLHAEKRLKGLVPCVLVLRFSINLECFLNWGPRANHKLLHFINSWNFYTLYIHFTNGILLLTFSKSYFIAINF